MNKLKVALQLYTIRDEMEKDFEGTLKRVKEMKYEGVEFAGLFEHKPAEIKGLLAHLDLIPISAHVPYTDMLNDPEKIMNDYRIIGCRYIAVPYLTEEYRLGTSNAENTIKGIKMIGEIAKKYGITLLYHNHDFEFKKTDGKYELDILYDSLPDDILQTELDTCWVNVAGEDPAAYIRKYAGRSPVVHLKDFVMPGKKPAHMYNLIGIDDDKSKADVNAFEFRPLGYGALNVPSIISASKDAGVEWAIVEQDNPGLGKSSMECAEMSIKYLESIR